MCSLRGNEKCLNRHACRGSDPTRCAHARDPSICENRSTPTHTRLPPANTRLLLRKLQPLGGGGGTALRPSLTPAWPYGAHRGLPNVTRTGTGAGDHALEGPGMPAISGPQRPLRLPLGFPAVPACHSPLYSEAHRGRPPESAHQLPPPQTPLKAHAPSAGSAAQTLSPWPCPCTPAGRPATATHIALCSDSDITLNTISQDPLLGGSQSPQTRRRAAEWQGQGQVRAGASE